MKFKRKRYPARRSKEPAFETKVTTKWIHICGHLSEVHWLFFVKWGRWTKIQKNIRYFCCFALCR